MILVSRMVVISAALLLLAMGCTGGDTPVEAEQDAQPGSLVGFVSPIDISVAEAILFDGDDEVMRVAFENGVFALESVPPGTYRLEIRAFGYLTNDAARNLRVLQGETTDLGRFIMIGRIEDSPQTPIVRGEVLDADSGAPIPGVAVRAECTSGFCTVQHAVTDASGSFSLPIPTELETRLVFTAAGYDGRVVLVEPTPRGELVQTTVRLIADPGGPAAD